MVTSTANCCYELVDVTGTMGMFLWFHCQRFFVAVICSEECFFSYPTFVVLSFINEVSDSSDKKVR